MHSLYVNPPKVLLFKRQTPRYFTFAGFGPFIIFDATAERAVAAVAATALPWIFV